jgi:hypothetical protein
MQNRSRTGLVVAATLVALRSRKRSSHHGIVRPNDGSSTTEGPKQDLDSSLSY